MNAIWEWAILVINSHEQYFAIHSFSFLIKTHTYAYHNIIRSHWSTVNIICSHSFLKRYHSLLFMVVFNKNEQDTFTTIDYCSYLVISFIFYTIGSFLMKRIRLSGNFFKSHPVLMNGTRIDKKSISLMLGSNPQRIFKNILISTILILFWSPQFPGSCRSSLRWWLCRQCASHPGKHFPRPRRSKRWPASLRSSPASMSSNFFCH